MMAMGGGWVIDLDVRKFFDRVDHGLLREVLRRRVRDGVLVRLIGKWLNAGVLEEGQWRQPGRGTPQGGVISPMLANIFLHEVLDTWFEDSVRPRLRGEAHLVRFADDALLVFACESDARRVMEVLPKRFARYGLELHPEDPGCAVRPARIGRRTAPGDLRFSRLHPLLGAVEARALGGQAQDGAGSAAPGHACNRSLVLCDAASPRG
ncbi:reverse transcriptase domain-containing protein [Aquisalimonas sp. 2447]|uniref:reverse transcriptase domain-containing protein n=1 Tax=Aquisalimonas sp. 2447 TaxID=2740807 RepID=UPI0020C3FB48|nr:reverse transcriptase domain-containing protein [Aquisalimonas sp. 2447]